MSSPLNDLIEIDVSESPKKNSGPPEDDTIIVNQTSVESTINKQNNTITKSNNVDNLSEISDHTPEYDNLIYLWNI